PIPESPDARNVHVRTREVSPILRLHRTSVVDAVRRPDDLRASECGSVSARAGIIAHRNGPAGEKNHDHATDSSGGSVFTIAERMALVSASMSALESATSPHAYVTSASTT